jgi:GDP-L-galactose phosphorylase
MSLTIKRVPTVVSMHQLDDADDPKANVVSKVCVPGRAMPRLSYAPRASHIKSMVKKVRSFGSFDDLRVPDLEQLAGDCLDDGFSGSVTDGNGSSFSDGGSSDGDTGSTGGGYVQDVSPFDRILLSAWEDRFAAGLFRYDVTACLTKVVPGQCGFVAQFNEGRATKKRPTEFSVDEVCQAFDGAKFNFTKADKAEVLFQFEDGRERPGVVGSEYSESEVIDAADPAPTVVLINVSPIEYGHVLLCPRVTDCLPQRISPEVLLPPLFMAAESRNPYFRVGYNSLGAYATINHLHFQAYYLMEAFPIERAPTKRLPPSVLPPKRHAHGIKVNRVCDYPVRCLCFERGDGFASLAEMVGVACERLQDANVPFNLLIADHGARVFLIPQKFSQRIAKGEVPEEVVKTGVNPAVFEISGHLLYKQREDYDASTEDAAVRMLECASLTEEDFLETCARILDDEQPAPLRTGLGRAVEDDRAGLLGRGFEKRRLETIRGSIDGGCSEVTVTTGADAAGTDACEGAGGKSPTRPPLESSDDDALSGGTA